MTQGTGAAWRRGGRLIGVGGLLVLTLVAVSIVNPRFATVENVRDLLVGAAPVVIVGCAMTVVVLLGEIDISVGSLLGLLAAVMGILASPQQVGLPVAVVVGALSWD